MSAQAFTISQVEVEQRNFITKVYSWMCIALVVTAVVALITVSNETFMRAILGNKILFFGLLIGEILMVGYLAVAIQRISANTAFWIFLGYSALNGLTLSVVFFIFTTASIVSTFFITSATFGIMSAYGYFTKKDLTSWGNLLMMGLVGIIIASIANFWLNNETIYWVTTYIGILIFVGLTAYDTQKIKRMNIIGNEGTEEDFKEAILGALMLYLDFINLFLLLLRLFGHRK